MDRDTQRAFNALREDVKERFDRVEKLLLVRDGRDEERSAQFTKFVLETSLAIKELTGKADAAHRRLDQSRKWWLMVGGGVAVAAISSVMQWFKAKVQ